MKPRAIYTGLLDPGMHKKRNFMEKFLKRFVFFSWNVLSCCWGFEPPRQYQTCQFERGWSNRGTAAMVCREGPGVMSKKDREHSQSEVGRPQPDNNDISERERVFDDSNVFSCEVHW